MAELRVKIPDDLKEEFRGMSDIELSIFVSKLVRDKLSRVKRFKQIVSKSELTEEQAKELADKVSEGLAKRYDKLAGE